MAFSSDSRTAAIPDRVDLREFLWPVEDLGSIYAAASSAVAAALEYHCNRMGQRPTNLSTLFIHYNARRISGDVAANKGTSIADAMKAVAAYGACREEAWPFDPKSFSKEPPQAAYDEAKPFAGIQFYNVADALESLGLHYPVPFFARIPQRCLTEAGRGGVMPALTEEELRNAKAHPGHGMALVGYDKTARTFIARNCWGEKWGDKGHCTIPFDSMKVFCPAGANHLFVITKPAMVKEAEPATAAEASPSRASDLAAKMREEIRGSLDKDLADAKKRITDMLRGPDKR